MVMTKKNVRAELIERPINYGRRPKIYIKDRLKDKAFSYFGNVHIRGDVTIEGELIVGGHLTVDGDLNAGSIYCVGRISAQGNIKGGDCFVGKSIYSGGSIDLCQLETGFNIEDMVRRLGLEDDDETGITAEEKLIHSRIANDLEFEIDFGDPVVKARKFLDCYVLVAHGDVEVDEWFDCDIAEINGNLSAENIFLEGDLSVYGGLVFSRDNLTCEELIASELRCNGNVECDSILVDGGDIAVLGSILTSSNIHASGNIQAGKWIAASGEIKCGAYVKAGEFVVSDKGISTGKDHGICAALCMPRSLWLERGYISAPKKPRNVLTGKFVWGKTWEIATDEESEREALHNRSSQD